MFTHGDDLDGLRAEPEAEWPGELPEHIEEWNELWWGATCARPLSGCEIFAITDTRLAA